MKRLVSIFCLLLFVGSLFGVDLKVSWTPRPTAEGATGYNIYRDNVKIGSVAAANAEYIDKSVPTGPHAYTVAATDMWGEGPKSDPVSTSPGVGKVTGVAVTVMAATTSVSLSVDKAITTIQMDLTTTGNVTLAQAVLDKGKSMSVSTVNGKLRVIIFGLNQTTFSGVIVSVDAPVTAVTNVVASDAVGAVTATVTIQ
jgi:hypothetical protein